MSSVQISPSADSPGTLAIVRCSATDAIASQRRRRALAMLLAAAIGAVGGSTNPADAAKKRAKTTVAAPLKPASPEGFTRANLVSTVKAAAIIAATRVGATVGLPVCPDPTKNSVVAQCLVTFDNAVAAFLVRNDSGNLVATPTFPILRSADIVAAASDAIGSSATCALPMKARVVVIAVGAGVACQAGNPPKGVIVSVVDASGRLTVATTG